MSPAAGKVMATLESPGVPATLRSHFVLMLKMLVSRGDLDYLSLEVWGWLARAGNELYNWPGEERTHYPGQEIYLAPTCTRVMASQSLTTSCDQ